ncbi:MAG: hypothetical protein ACAH88_04020, partial [Roseimicrobium sp.]
FRRVAEQVAIVMGTRKPITVCSDAIEYYNPVHDLAAPITRAALVLAGLTECRHYEVPLVHQAPDPAGLEKYLVQRLPVEHADNAVVHTLPQAALEAKRTARDEVYSILAEQFGNTLTDLSMEHLGHEVISESSGELKRGPGDAYVLRYEWRARALLKRGEIQEMITLEDHFQPVADALVFRSGSEQQKTPLLPLRA